MCRDQHEGLVFGLSGGMTTKITFFTCFHYVHPMCPQYARNNFCQPCPALENTTTSSNREKQENHVVSLSHREIAISSPFRDPKNDPEASISTESALMCTHCTRNMLGTTFVSHTQPWKTPQHRQNREKQENHVFHCHIGNSSPFRDPQNDPEASISTESALMCTHCTRNMLGTTFCQPYPALEDTRTSSKS